MDERGAIAEEAALARRHVFMVNSSEEILAVVRLFLHDARYAVTTTNYTPRIFEQIAALRPDVLVLDLALGEQAGWGLLARLRAKATTRDIPVVVTSTQRESLDRVGRDPARYGDNHLQIMPFDADALLGAIRRLAEGR